MKGLGIIGIIPFAVISILFCVIRGALRVHKENSVKNATWRSEQ